MSVDSRRSNREKLEEFIDSYRKLPCLWQIKSKEYHIHYKKNAAYQQLVDVLKEIELDANRESVIRKINTYRTNYRKEQKKVENSKKSGAGINDVYVPSLWFYDKLNFIRDQETPRTLQSNLTEESTEESTTEETEGVVTEEIETDGVEIYTESSSDAVQSSQASTSSTVVQSLHPPTPSRNRSRPTKRTSNSDSVTEDVLLSVRDHFKRPAVPEDGCDVFGKMVAIKLRDLPREQRLFAEKIITDTLFEAQFGKLTISHKLTSSPLLNQVPQQIHRQQMLSEPHYSNNRNINYNLQSQQSQPTYFHQIRSHAPTRPDPQISDSLGSFNYRVHFPSSKYVHGDFIFSV